MLAFRRTMPIVPADSVRALTASSSAARKQTRACSLLESKIAQLESRRAPPPNASAPAGSAAQANNFDSESREQMDREYELVKDELDKYIRDGVLMDEELDDFDLCRWWQVRL